MTAPAAAAVDEAAAIDEVDALAAAAELELDVLPHPATITAAVVSAAIPATRNLPVLRPAIIRSQLVVYLDPVKLTVSFEDPGDEPNLPCVSLR
jgi:hypothetical protein